MINAEIQCDIVLESFVPKVVPNREWSHMLIDIHSYDFGFLDFKIYFIDNSLWDWNPNQLFIHNRESSIYMYIYIFQILGLQDEMHSIWNLWTNDLQECKNNLFGIKQSGHNNCRSGSIFSFLARLPKGAGLRGLAWHPLPPWWDHDSTGWGPPKWHEL